MTQTEKNRKIAEGLGWRLIIDIWICPPCFEHKHVVECKCTSTLPDFYTDEAANAMVLDAMPWPDLHKNEDAGGWYCAANKYKTPSVYCADRKTAICGAYLKMLDAV